MPTINNNAIKCWHLKCLLYYHVTLTYTKFWDNHTFMTLQKCVVFMVFDSDG